MIPQQPGPNPFHSASLYVGDINPDVNEAKLFEMFNRVGPVASIRVCRDAVTRRSLGYAYVNFHQVSDAERALDTMNYADISGRPCRIMWSQRDPSLRKSGLGNVFVKNLAPTVDNKSLFDVFSVFGNILSCKVVCDEVGNSKGYGYVHYETQEAAEQAIAKLNGLQVEGCEVTVTQFVRRPERTSQREWTNLYVKNLPRSWGENELRDLFTPYGEITSVRVMRIIDAPAVDAGMSPGDISAPDSSRGFGFVNFTHHESALKATEELNMKEIEDEGKSYTLYVNRAQKRQERQREIRKKREILKMERLNKYQGMNLYVKNLDDSITDEEFRELFAVFGTITSARVMRGEDGTSKGFGFVCFSIPEEATKAVEEMHNQLVRSKPLFVTLHQRKEHRMKHLTAMINRMGGAMPRGFPMGQSPMYHPMGMYQPPMQPRPPNFMMPPGMMPRGGPRGVPGGYPRGYPVPPYNMPMQSNGNQRRGGPNPGRGAAPRAQAPAGGRSNFKYTSQARNHPSQQGMPAPMLQSVPAPGPGPAPMPQPMPGPVPHMPPVEPVDHSMLAQADPQTQKNMIGERLYPLIHSVKPAMAPKITGMLLEMDNAELLGLLEDHESLNAKIEEALNVLAQHNLAAAAQRM